MQEIWVQSLGGEDPLEKEMDTHSWKISWIEEFGSLQSMGLQRVGCDLVTEQKTSYIPRSRTAGSHANSQFLKEPLYCFS